MLAQTKRTYQPSLLIRKRRHGETFEIPRAACCGTASHPLSPAHERRVALTLPPRPARRRVPLAPSDEGWPRRAWPKNRQGPQKALCVSALTAWQGLLRGESRRKRVYTT